MQTGPRHSEENKGYDLTEFRDKRIFQIETKNLELMKSNIEVAARLGSASDRYNSLLQSNVQLREQLTSAKNKLNALKQTSVEIDDATKKLNETKDERLEISGRIYQSLFLESQKLKNLLETRYADINLQEEEAQVLQDELTKTKLNIENLSKRKEPVVIRSSGESRITHQFLRSSGNKKLKLSGPIAEIRAPSFSEGEKKINANKFNK